MANHFHSKTTLPYPMRALFVRNVHIPGPRGLERTLQARKLRFSPQILVFHSSKRTFFIPKPDSLKLNGRPKIDVGLLGIRNPFELSEIKQLGQISSLLYGSWQREAKLFAKDPKTVGEQTAEAFERIKKDMISGGLESKYSEDLVAEHFLFRHFLLNSNVSEFEYLDPEVQELAEKFTKNGGKLLETEYPAKADLVEAWNTVLTNWNMTEQVSGTEGSVNAIDIWAAPIYNQKVQAENAANAEKGLEEDQVKSFFDQLQKALEENKKNQSKTLQSSSDKKKASSKPDPNLKTINVDINAESLAKYLLLAAVILFLGYLSTAYAIENSEEMTFQDFTAKFLAPNLVHKLTVINNSSAVIELNENGQQKYPGRHRYHFNIGNIELFERNMIQVQNELGIAEESRLPVLYISEGSSLKVLINFLPTVLFLGAIYYMTKKAGASMGGPLGFGKSTAKKFNEESEIKIRFKDVAGMSEAKEEVMEFVKFLQNPEKYQRLGARIPRGAILSGPPGTGKTLLAKATAGEAGVPFYSVSGSEFIEMFVGVGALRVRDLFKTARANAPSIVFVDEIDAIGKQRAKGNASGANDERETTLNQLLVEMDGFNTDDHVVVLAGTNRSDILDKALMRPGRFDRHIQIDNPELSDRKEIFDVHLQKITLAADIDPDLSNRLAALTPGFSGADIANVCNESALIAARYNAEAVTLRHFELAIERVIGGIEKKLKLMSPEEQRIVAFHEAGHAICGWFLKYASPLLKVSIIPRGQGALGYAQYLPADRYLESTAQLHDRMVMTLGGRVSEELNFKSVTSGAHDDFKKVTQVAQNMVMRFGMSKEVGMINYFDSRDSEDLTKPFSEETNRVIDSEVQRIVRECYDECRALLTEKKAEVTLVAEELIKKEFITREDMIRLLGKRPFPETNDAFDKYLDKNPAFRNQLPDSEHKDVE